MKIGYICNQSSCVSGPSNGIRMQALIWADALRKKGHEVVLIDAWGSYDWSTFDLVHSFCWGESDRILYKLKERNIKIVVSPIIDTTQPRWLYSAASYIGIKAIGLTQPSNQLRNLKSCVDIFLARSEYEKKYIQGVTGFDDEDVKIVPLSYRSEDTCVDMSKKEDFCFHVSSITQGRKNVLRLVKAAIKYNFKLVLAGSTKPEKEFKPLKELITQHDNIQCLGFISDEQLNDLYTRAKVFALPSIREGVGLVALEAAMHGCDVVITGLGGPKEYYTDKYAYIVDPYSVDSIGKAVVAALTNSKQPQLKEHIEKNYNVDTCVNSLIEIYEFIL